jgi:hypothetical protein
MLAPVTAVARQLNGSSVVGLQSSTAPDAGRQTPDDG